VNILDLLYFLVLHCFQFNADFLAQLHILPVGHVMVVQNIHIAHPLGLQIAL
jgi:hypothetical protein